MEMFVGKEDVEWALAVVEADGFGSQVDADAAIEWAAREWLRSRKAEEDVSVPGCWVCARPIEDDGSDVMPCIWAGSHPVCPDCGERIVGARFNRRCFGCDQRIPIAQHQQSRQPERAGSCGVEAAARRVRGDGADACG